MSANDLRSWPCKPAADCLSISDYFHLLGEIRCLSTEWVSGRAWQTCLITTSLIVHWSRVRVRQCVAPVVWNETVIVSHAASHDKNRGMGDVNGENLTKQTLFSSVSNRILLESAQGIRNNWFWQISANPGSCESGESWFPILVAFSHNGADSYRIFQLVKLVLFVFLVTMIDCCFLSFSLSLFLHLFISDVSPFISFGNFMYFWKTCTYSKNIYQHWFFIRSPEKM